MKKVKLFVLTSCAVLFASSVVCAQDSVANLQSLAADSQASAEKEVQSLPSKNLSEYTVEDYERLRKLAATYEKSIKEMAKDMTAEEKAAFNAKLAESVKETEVKMKAQIDALSAEDKAAYEQSVKEYIQKLEMK